MRYTLLIQRAYHAHSDTLVQLRSLTFNRVIIPAQQ